MNLLVFAGTTEGTAFTQQALAAGHSVTVSVATDYGADLLRKNVRDSADALRVLHGRLDADAIAALVPPFDALVDATHPYAAEISRNLRTASRRAAVPYFRLARPAQPVVAERLREFDDLPALVTALAETTGNVFVATGSSTLAPFTALPGWQDRLYVRVLPSSESIEACRAAGIDPAHIIALHGACGTELNKSLFAEYDCRILVTKESGAAGGFAEKIAAAQERGMEIFALRPPAEHAAQDGTLFFSADDLLAALRARDFFAALTGLLGD